MIADLAESFEALAIKLRILAEQEAQRRRARQRLQSQRLAIRESARAVATGRDPMPADASAEFHRMVARLASDQRRQDRNRKIRDLHRAGYPLPDIAARVGTSERTVTRTLNGG